MACVASVWRRRAACHDSRPGGAASTKHELEDLINVALEQLIRSALRAAGLRHAQPGCPPRPRHSHASAVWTRLHCPESDDLTRMDLLFVADLTTLRTPWNELKANAANPTLSHLPVPL
jgi:hypothetical protein